MEMEHDFLSDLEAIKSLEIPSGYIGTGGTGSHVITDILEYEDPEENPYLRCLAVDANGKQLKQDFGTEAARAVLGRWGNRINVKQIGPGLGAGGDHHFGMKLMIQNIQLIDEFLLGNPEKGTKPLEHLVVVAGMGGGSGMGAAPVIAARAAFKFQIPTLTVAVKPFAFECKRIAPANETVQLLKKITPTTVVYNQQLLKPGVSRKISPLELWKDVNAVSTRVILKSTNVFTQKVGNIKASDLMDVMKIYEVGNDMIWGFLKLTSSVTNAEKIAEELVSAPYQDGNIIHTTGGLYFWFEGPWFFDEVENVITETKKKVNNKTENDLVFNYGFNHSDGEKWVFMIATGGQKTEREDVKNHFAQAGFAEFANSLDVSQKADPKTERSTSQEWQTSPISTAEMPPKEVSIPYRKSSITPVVWSPIRKDLADRYMEVINRVNPKNAENILKEVGKELGLTLIYYPEDTELWLKDQKRLGGFIRNLSPAVAGGTR